MGAIFSVIGGFIVQLLAKLVPLLSKEGYGGRVLGFLYFGRDCLHWVVEWLAGSTGLPLRLLVVSFALGFP